MLWCLLRVATGPHANIYNCGTAISANLCDQAFLKEATGCKKLGEKA
jgi:hypothetical protein